MQHNRFTHEFAISRCDQFWHFKRKVLFRGVSAFLSFHLISFHSMEWFQEEQQQCRMHLCCIQNQLRIFNHEF